MKAAIFKDKALVTPSDCTVHPKYQALKPPTSEKEGCVCQNIYDMVHPRQEVHNLYEQGH